MPQKKLTDAFIKSVDLPSKRRVEYYDTYVSGLCLRVTKNGTKTFSYEYKLRGRKKRLTIGSYKLISLKEARDKCKEAKVSVQKGLDPKSEIEARKKKDILTVDSLIEKYKDEHLSTLAKKTRIEYTRYLDDRINKHFGKFDPNKINRRDVIEFLDNIAKKEGHPVTANRVKATLSGLFTYGMHKSLIKSDPTKDIKKKKEKSRDRIYSNSEIKELWNFFNKMNAPTGYLYKILLLFARRKKEVMKSKWKNVDLEKNIWTLPKEDTKNNESLPLPITPFASAIFKKLKEHSKKSPYVFQSPVNEDTPIVSDSYARYKVKRETDVSDFTAHDLRRTAITLIAKEETPPHIGKRISGHSQKETYDIYNRYNYINEIENYLTLYHASLKNIIK